MNTLIVSGNVGQDAEVRSVRDSSVCNFSLAEKQGYGDGAQTVWYRVEIWGKRGETVAPHVKKGMKLVVAGELSMDEYQGKPQYRLRADRLDFVSPKQEGSTGNGGPQRRGESRNPYEVEDDGDDVPFASCDPALERRVR